MAKRPTLQDVADLAEVSIGTASRVLNNKPNVLPETRHRVLAAAQKLAYYRAPEPVASANPLTFGVLANLLHDENPFANPFYGEVIAGIDAECHAQQIKLMYATFLQSTYANRAGWPLMISDPQVNGLILMGMFTQEMIDDVRQYSGKALVLVDPQIQSNPYDSVLADNYTGSYQAIRFLIEQGHRHIAIVGSAPDSGNSFVQRRRGYMQALSDYDIADTYFANSSPLQDEVFDATLALLRQSPQITAIFACFDAAASVVYQAVQVLNLRIPDELSIVGFDDLSLAERLMPPLTTMHVDTRLMGMLGVRQLVERLQNPDRVTTQILMRPQLVVRDSVKALS